ncbi:serine hydrolase domain-containing protein [Galbibacter pacificus]|uniref:Serine hydrolase n=1 Tax=Galbibacter pacificus TaxID=2996052 RepID=A0ABT6FQI6_9FLAO|nr:serine hydrolase domain-containing protein [Galbibacter pacificus]MDG3582003.1 serine hydrolase [Galbibacter pacificus]MDG3585523.1 serine hydrolase [Galbibacter pacificus]
MKVKKYASMLMLFVAIINLSVLSAQTLPETSPEAVGISSNRLTYLTKTFNDFVKDDALPGSVLLVARHGKIAYYKAFGKKDIEKNVPMKKTDMFRIASQTKAIVSVGIMMLQEQGKLSITDEVGKYIPEFKKTTVAVAKEDGSYNVVAAKRAITLRDLLTHTSGIGYGNGIAADKWKEAGIQGWYFADRKEPILETVKKMGNLPFDAQPGEQFVYGYSIDILGAIIEVVSGETLNDFLHTNILGPLKMNDTYFYLPKDKKDRLAVVYSPSGNGLEKAPNPGGMVGQGAYVDGPRTSYSGGAGLVSTASDYARFLQMMLNKGTLNGARILSRKSVELMTVNHLRNIKFPWADGTGFGLGFTVVEDLGARGTMGSVGEYGWGGAYHSTYWVDPKEDMVVVYLTQVIPTKTMEDHEKLHSLIYQALEE